MSQEHHQYVDKLQSYVDALRAGMPTDGGDTLTLIQALINTPEPTLGYEALVRDARHLLDSRRVL